MALRIFRHYVSPAKVYLASADALIVFGGAAAAIAFKVNWLGQHMDHAAVWFLAPLVFTVISSPLMVGFGVYSYESLRDFKAFLARLAAGYGLGLGLMGALLFSLDIDPAWRLILISSFLLAGLGIILTHGFFPYLAGEDRFRRRTVVIGAGVKAEAILGYLADDMEFGMDPVAVWPLPGDTVDDKCKPLIQKTPKLGTLVDDMKATSVLLAATDTSKLPLEELVTLRMSGVDVISHQAFYEEMRGYVTLEDLSPEWLLIADGFKGATLFDTVAKRLLDILVSLTLLVLCSPLLLIAAILVVITSKGGLFYRQERVGLLGKTFHVLKLRTMVADAEKSTGAKWAQQNDPRVTAVGRFLRASRIDEIPQVINVLKGDMSFVGPRPERPEFVQELEKTIPYYRERHFVKPGITGWAQIRFPYGASADDSKRKLEYDLYYIKNYSLFLDLLIILQTARVVLFQKGAR